MADLEGFWRFRQNPPPFGLYLVLRSTDDRLTRTPLSGYRTKKTAVMAHLSMLQQKIHSKIENRSIGLVRLVVALENYRKWVWLLNFCTQEYDRTLLQEILDLPQASCLILAQAAL